MKNIILTQPQQLTHSITANKEVAVSGDFDAIILAGLGGSGHPGDMLNALGVSNVPLYVHRNYDLPLDYLKSIGFKNPLVIVSSYSGNTEEALTAYQAAQANNLSILVSTSGGTLAEWANRDSQPHALIDFPDMQPRHTLFAAFAGIATALANSGLAENQTEAITQAVALLEKEIPGQEERGRELAEHIQGKVPVFTSTDNLGFATKNFKIQTNENAKYPAFWNTFPELNHNELVGFSKLAESNNPNQFYVLILRDPADHPRNQARMDATRDLYREWGITVDEYTVTGTTPLEKLCTTITLGLWTTCFLAEANGIDPVPVDGVENFKAKLKEIAGDIA